MTAGRRPGGHDTKVDILAAARREFASGGFRATTVRKVAATAGCDPALLHHYYGTKADLFRAAVDIRFDPSGVVAAIAAAPMDDRGRVMIESVLKVWESPAGRSLMAGVRTMIADEAQMHLVKNFVFSQLIEPATAGLTGSDRHWRRNLVASQMMGVAVTRYVIGTEPMASANREDVVAAVAPVLQRYLTGDIGSDPGPHAK